jgi:hypothetical protein
MPLRLAQVGALLFALSLAQLASAAPPPMPMILIPATGAIVSDDVPMHVMTSSPYDLKTVAAIGTGISSPSNLTHNGGAPGTFMLSAVGSLVAILGLRLLARSKTSE